MKHLLCFFRSPRNIYVAADGMEILYGQGADPVRTLVAIKPPFNVSSWELTYLTQFPIGKVIPGYLIDGHSACMMGIPLQASRPQGIEICRCLRIW